MKKRLLAILLMVFVLTITGCGKQIGFVDGDKDDRVYEYDGYSTDEWNNVSKEEGIYVYDDESQISEIALSFSLKNISTTGATLVFDQYDADAPKGELMFGEDFVIEVLC